MFIILLSFIEKTAKLQMLSWVWHLFCFAFLCYNLMKCIAVMCT